MRSDHLRKHQKTHENTVKKLNEKPIKDAGENIKNKSSKELEKELTVSIDNDDHLTKLNNIVALTPKQEENDKMETSFETYINVEH